MPVRPGTHKPLPPRKDAKPYRWEHTKTTTQRGYGAEWQRLRRSVMMRDSYLCQPCDKAGRTTQATEVDHIMPKAQGGTDEPDNLQAICRQCHRTKTARESR